MEILAFIVFAVIAFLIYGEIKQRRWAREGLADLREKGFNAATICDFGDTKIAFDSASKQMAFVNFQTRIPNRDQGPLYFRSTTTEPYSNLKHLRIDRQKRDLDSSGGQTPTLVFTFHAPNRRDGKLELWAVVSCFGSEEIEKLMKAWPEKLEVRP